MQRLLQIGMVLAWSGAAFGQMHKVAKPETVVRAVGVYEWTGELAKPTASRLLPVTVYIDKKLEDAGVYLARPVPFALQTGNIYELDEAGVPKGNVELVYARHLQAADIAQAYDDGWFGYGSFKAPPVPKKTIARKLPPARTSGIETASTAVDPDKPHFVNKAGQPVVPKSENNDSKADTGRAGEAAATPAPAAAPDRPKFSNKDSAAADAKPDATDGSGATPAGDPDRPTMKRRSGNDTATASSTGTDGSSTPADDPDRPTLKRRAPDDAKKKGRDPDGSVTGVGSLNDDPDRPNLHRGKPTSALTEAELPKLAGLPADLRQMVAVSDAANRPVHDFTRAWEDDAERAAILGKMQAMAQAQIAAYVALPTNSSATSKSIAAARSSSKLKRPQKFVQTPPGLLDEQLKGYLLSYGDVPTFVYQAHTDGTGIALRYVTLVTQLDAQHEPKVVLQSITDGAHLDRTARLRLVDAVDVEASNRASLLFEMRGQTSRQFGVYRVLGLQAQQIFSTGTMQ